MFLFRIIVFSDSSSLSPSIHLLQSIWFVVFFGTTSSLKLVFCCFHSFIFVMAIIDDQPMGFMNNPKGDANSSSIRVKKPNTLNVTTLEINQPNLNIIVIHVIFWSSGASSESSFDETSSDEFSYDESYHISFDDFPHTSSYENFGKSNKNEQTNNTTHASIGIISGLLTSVRLLSDLEITSQDEQWTQYFIRSFRFAKNMDL